MNPLSLLTKGRTFKDMTPRPGAYKMLAEDTLPKTINTKPLAKMQTTTHQTLFDTPAPAEDRAPVIPPVSGPFAASGPVQPSGSVWGSTRLFCRRLVQRFILGRKGVQRPGVQTELALEKVTVLRNDLNDDDLEVVLVKRKVGTGEKPLARLSKMEMTGDAWNRLTAPFRKKSNESAVNPKAETKEAPELSART